MHRKIWRYIVNQCITLKLLLVQLLSCMREHFDKQMEILQSLQDSEDDPIATDS